MERRPLITIKTFLTILYWKYSYPGHPRDENHFLKLTGKQITLYK